MEIAQKKGIYAVNQDFKKYEKVTKNQAYRLAEHESLEEFDDRYEIATCDMSRYFTGGEADKARFAAELGAALEGIGFAILVGHGIDEKLYETATEKVIELFETTSVADRL